MTDENPEPSRLQVGTHYDTFIGGLGIPIEFKWGVEERQNARGLKRIMRRRYLSITKKCAMCCGKIFYRWRSKGSA